MRIFNAEKLPRPRLTTEQEQELNSFVNNSAPLDLEIGAGVGFQALQYTKNHPERFLISIERTEEKFEKFFRRFENHNRPKNLLPVHADAISLVHYYLPPQKIERAFFYYPNPESKNPTQRWINMPFFGRLIALLPPQASIQFVTNEEFYYQELLREYSKWPLQLARQRTFILKDQAPHFRTHFEKKYLERGETCYEVEFKVFGDPK